MSPYTWAWIFWLASFATIEGFALANRKPDDTLSEHIWSWFAIRGKPGGWQARRAVLLMFLVWLVAHLLTGGAV